MRQLSPGNKEVEIKLPQYMSTEACHLNGAHLVLFYGLVSVLCQSSRNIKKTPADYRVHKVKRGEEISIMLESATIHTASHSAILVEGELCTSTKQFSGTTAQG